MYGFTLYGFNVLITSIVLSFVGQKEWSEASPSCFEKKGCIASGQMRCRGL